MFSLCNVVYYDGEEAYVTQFLLEIENNLYITDDAKDRLNKYLEGRGKLLHIDEKITVIDLDDIIQMKTGSYNCFRFRFGEGAQFACYDRFKEMYF